MSDLATVAPAFVEMAHRIVWAGVATTDRNGRPRTRILHPIWEWDGVHLVGWIGTTQSPVKRAHLARQPYVSVNYWAPTHDTAEALCRAEWRMDDETRTRVWNLLKDAPSRWAMTRPSSQGGPHRPRSHGPCCAWSRNACGSSRERC